MLVEINEIAFRRFNILVNAGTLNEDLDPCRIQPPVRLGKSQKAIF